jgi:hypothetical protein
MAQSCRFNGDILQHENNAGESQGLNTTLEVSDDDDDDDDDDEEEETSPWPCCMFSHPDTVNEREAEALYKQIETSIS